MIAVLFILAICENKYVESTDKTTLEISCTSECGLILKSKVQETKLYESYENVIVRDGPTGINDEGFINCIKLKTISLSKTIKIINSKAFMSCSLLASISLPEGLDSLGTMCFFRCNSLEWIYIPSTLTYLDYTNTFYDCKSLIGFNVSNNTIYRSLNDKTILCKGTEIIAFSSKYQSVVIPASITSIASAAFNGCGKLESVTFEDGNLTAIKSSAFRQCSFKTITIPYGVTELGSAVFDRSMVETVNLPSSLTSVHVSVFQDASKLTTVNAQMCSGLSVDENNVIYNPEKSSIIFIPNDITEFFIPLTLLTVSASQITVASKLKKLTVEVNHSNYRAHDNVLYSNDYAHLVGCPGGVPSHTVYHNCTHIDGSAFRNVGIKSISFEGSDLLYIGSYCFEGTRSLTAVVFNEKLLTMGEGAFYRSAITSLKLPASVTGIAGGAFAYASIQTFDASSCKNLKKIGGFSECLQLTTVVLAEGLQEIDEAGFSNDVLLAEIRIPSTVVSIGVGAFSNSGLTSVIFEGGCPLLRTLGSSAFSGTKITSIDLPKNVTELGERLFSGCTQLQTLNIGGDSGLTRLTPYFVSETAVEQLSFGARLEFIDECSFAGCLTLSEISINASNKFLSAANNIILSKNGDVLVVCPNGLNKATVEGSVKEIRSSAFFGCSKLNDLTFNESCEIRSIGKNTFYGCSALQMVTIPASVQGLLDSSFSGCVRLSSFIIPTNSNLNQIGQGAFLGCWSLSEITLENATRLTTINISAFEGCEALKSVVIPGTVETLSSRSFFGCVRLRKVKYCPEVPKDIGDASVFEGCDNVFVYLPNTYLNKTFCGVSPFAVLDSQCNVPTSAFTLPGDALSQNQLLIASMSLIGSDAEGGQE